MKDQNNDHEYFMRKCIELALIAKQHGESPVGSVIVKDEKIIASGSEASKLNRDLTFHAEIEAIRRAVALLDTTDLSSCTLYTTHEPCIMCSYVIRHAKINTIVIGITTGETGGVSSAYQLLLDRSIKSWADPPQLVFGVLKKECIELNS